MDDRIVRLAALQEAGEDLSPTTEEAMALEFADRHGSELRYVAAWGRWLAYDGSRWVHDDTLHAFDRARAICREIAITHEKQASSIASAKTVAAIVRLAQADRRLAATFAQWDAAPLLLATDGGTVDLQTGISRRPHPRDYLTRKTTCAAAPPDTPHPLWTKFLDRVTNHDAGLQGFLQRYIGYCCTGLTSEHAFVFAYGTGANGKSTFVNTIAKVMGDYVSVAPMETFIATSGDRHPTEIAKLCGARLVVAQETQKGRRWDETKIKALTGGDKITGRFMRQDFFDFTPTFKLLIAGNHKPRLGTVDEAMRRRLLIVPFTIQIPQEERDPDLSAKLEDEHPAILRWCITGCLAWQQTGLAPPASVLDATDTYFADQDVLQQWLDDCTHDAGPLAFSSTSELFSSWKSWCDERNLGPGTAMAFSNTLVDRGFSKTRDGTGHRGFTGLTIKR